MWATDYVNKDMFFKVFYQAHYDATGGPSRPLFELQRETIHLLYVWRFLPVRIATVRLPEGAV